MIRRSDTTVFPDGVTPEPGIYVTVKDDSGALATLYDDVGASKPNPFTTDPDGTFYYNIADADAGAFLEEYRLSLADAPRTTIAVTLSAFGPSGPTGATGATGAAGDVSKAADRTELAATVGMAAKATRWLAEAGREGLFQFDSSNLSALVTADSRQAVYVAPTSDATGATGAWVRKREGDYLHIDWFGPAGDGVSDDTAVFVAIRTLGIALSTGAATGVRQGPTIWLGRKTYRLLSDYDNKGFAATWRGVGSGFVGWNNTGGSVIKMASGKTWYIQRANTEGSGVGTTIAYGADGSAYHDITWLGAGKAVGSAPVVQLRANSVHFYNCRIEDAGGIGLFIWATTGGGTTSEGNANVWRWFGGGIANCGGSGIKTLGADANAGVFVGNVSGCAGYGIEEEGFLGNDYNVHCDGNTLGHLHGTGASNSSRFRGYFESGYPVCTIPARALVEPTGGVNPAGTTGASFGASESLAAVNGLVADRNNGAGSRSRVYLASNLTLGFLTRASNTHWASEAYSLDCWARQDADIIHWGINNASAYAAINGDGSSGARYTHGRAIAPSGAYSLTTLWLGDGAFPDGRRFISVTAAPADISIQGDYSFNRGVTAAGIMGWACTVGGLTGGTQTPDYIYPRADPLTGIGYVTGAGGTVVQATSKATGVTLNKASGQITMNAAALASGAIVSFVLTNSAIAAGDVLVLNHISGGTPGSYTLNARSAAGSATIDVRNGSAGSLSEAIVIAYALIKAVAA